ncbi:hypothetical protein PLESTF_000846000 [Pleodorina starrii]|nr:hypothetical protein PLESTM_001873300 [Pleodorina starrii]GLC69547.1 hypothetical protein PLESTF_000846000 [Pleodorina starrii]
MQAAARALDREEDDAYAGYEDDEDERPYSQADLDGEDLANDFQGSKKKATREAYDKQFRKFKKYCKDHRKGDPETLLGEDLAKAGGLFLEFIGNAKTPDGVTPKVYEAYHVGDASAKKPPLQLLENKYGPTWRSPWYKRWSDFKTLFTAIDSAAVIRGKGTKEAAQFWASKQGTLTLEQQRGFIKKLREGTAKDDNGRLITFNDYVSIQRPGDFLSPPKPKVRRPDLYSGLEALPAEGLVAADTGGRASPTVQSGGAPLFAVVSPSSAAHFAGGPAAQASPLTQPGDGRLAARGVGASPSAAAALAAAAHFTGGPAAQASPLTQPGDGRLAARGVGASPSAAAALAAAAHFTGGPAAQASPLTQPGDGRLAARGVGASPSAAAALAAAAHFTGGPAAQASPLTQPGDGRLAARGVGASPSAAAALAAAAHFTGGPAAQASPLTQPGDGRLAARGVGASPSAPLLYWYVWATQATVRVAAISRRSSMNL